MKRAAARIGPTVCELDGPMPIENRSKTLTATRARYGLGATSTLGGSADGSGCIERRTMLNATAPPTAVASPRAPNTHSRRWRAMRSAARLLQGGGKVGDHLLDRRGLLGEFLAHLGEFLARRLASR